MKNLLISLTVLLVSCTRPNIETKETGMVYGSGENGTKVQIYRLGRCQYIGRLVGSETDWATHSGECDNPRHLK